MGYDTTLAMPSLVWVRILRLHHPSHGVGFLTDLHDCIGKTIMRDPAERTDLLGRLRRRCMRAVWHRLDVETVRVLRSTTAPPLPCYARSAR